MSQHPLSLAHTRRLGDNAGMAGDDGRAQVHLDEDTLASRRRDLGEDHPDTLAAASNLAVSLRAAGEYQAARELDEDTLARRRRVLGEDHPDTLASADGLAVSLRAVLGHPGTVTSARSLAASVGHPGEYQAARELDEDTLARQRRVLDEDHPTPWPPLTASPSACVRSASARRPGSWTKTPWPAAAGSWARTTPTPWPRPTTSPSACRGSAGRRPGSWAKIPWPAAAGSWARTTPTPWPPPTTSS